MEKVIISWSGGKDSALALNEIRKSNKYEIVSLLTTITEDYKRVSMHGFREELLEAQASSLDLPLTKIFISKNTSNKQYEENMKNTLSKLYKNGVLSVVFGDIFLEDLKKYREEKLAKVKMNALFPIWKRQTSKLAQEFISLGYKAILTCVDTKLLDGKFSGRSFDKQLISNLPANIDACGENGEFHSFVYDGPIFSKEIPFTKGEIVLREQRFSFCDLLANNHSSA
ncbi:MAG: diphthine--ammonia ligase [Actinobacteria bacterium]|nr:MAG: diphthine--ammonia ligase [Actinomycetota bacterium]